VYACIPLVGADYLASQLPHFLLGAPATLPAFGRTLVGSSAGTGTAQASRHLLSVTGVVWTQVAVIGLGALASLVAGWRIMSQLEPAPAWPGRVLTRAAAAATVLAIAASMTGLTLAPLSRIPAQAPTRPTRPTTPLSPPPAPGPDEIDLT
jgi:hypothetical protein